MKRKGDCESCGRPLKKITKSIEEQKKRENFEGEGHTGRTLRKKSEEEGGSVERKDSRSDKGILGEEDSGEKKSKVLEGNVTC